MTGYRLYDIPPHQIGKEFGSTRRLQFQQFHYRAPAEVLLAAIPFKKPADMDAGFHRKGFSFFGKHTFNVHFLRINVHFFCLNVHFFIHGAVYVQVPIEPLILFI